MEFESVVHYPGALDIALVKVFNQNEMENIRVFPCLLSNEGWQHVISRKMNGILDLATSNSKNKFKIKIRGVPVKVFTDSTCPEKSVCYRGKHGKLSPKKLHRISDSVFFVKVGRTKWSLAGISGNLFADGEGMVSPMHPAIRWINDTIESLES